MYRSIYMLSDSDPVRNNIRECDRLDRENASLMAGRCLCEEGEAEDREDKDRTAFCSL